MSDVKKWIKQNTIFECVSGSHAYGLNTPESDIDYRGVCIPPIDYYLGNLQFEQLVENKPDDRTIFELKKFIKLASDCNPNIIELLYMPEDSVEITTPIFDKLIANRHLFLSTKAKHTYSGYAMAQLKRIKGHRQWLLNPIKKKPERGDFGLPSITKLPPTTLGAIESVMREELELHQTDLYTLTEKEFGDVREQMVDRKLFDSDIMQLYDAERRFRNAKMNWDSYQNWIKSRNPKRAELEKKFGYDTKHAGHLVRLFLQGEEMLRDGTLTVRLNKDHLYFVKEIKAGSLSYDELIEWAEKKDEMFNELYKTSILQKKPDLKAINDLQIEIIQEFYKGNNIIAKL